MSGMEHRHKAVTAAQRMRALFAAAGLRMPDAPAATSPSQHGVPAAPAAPAAAAASEKSAPPVSAATISQKSSLQGL